MNLSRRSRLSALGLDYFYFVPDFSNEDVFVSHCVEPKHEGAEEKGGNQTPACSLLDLREQETGTRSESLIVVARLTDLARLQI